MKSRVLKTVICVVMIMAILCFSLSVFADNELVIPTDNPYTVINETEDYFWRLWIWGALKSFGIDISIGDVVEYTDALDQYMESLILSYLETIPSISNWNQWIFPWVGGINSSGFFEGNSNFVEDVNDFAQWLITKYNPGNDNVIEIDSYDYIIMDGEKYPIYKAPRNVFNYLNNGVYDTWYPCWSKGYSVGYDVLEGLKGFEFNHTYLLESGVYFRADTSQQKTMFATDPECENLLGHGFTWSSNPNFLNNFAYTRDDLQLRDNNPNAQYGPWYAYNGHNQVYFFGYFGSTAVNKHYTMLVDIEWASGANSNNPYNDRENHSLNVTDYVFDNYFLPHSINGQLTTGIVTIPDDNDGYQPGDSIVIIDGEPNYLVIEFPDSVSVDNLPASIIPSNLSDPELEEAYRSIRSFVNVAHDGMESLIGLINEMPEQAIVCVYAVISGVIIFGIIKLFREH